MAKYLLFQNNEFYRMAPNEAKRDNWLRTPNIVAKEVSDAPSADEVYDLQHMVYVKNS